MELGTLVIEKPSEEELLREAADGGLRCQPSIISTEDASCAEEGEEHTPDAGAVTAAGDLLLSHHRHGHGRASVGSKGSSGSGNWSGGSHRRSSSGEGLREEVEEEENDDGNGNRRMSCCAMVLPPAGSLCGDTNTVPTPSMDKASSRRTTVSPPALLLMEDRGIDIEEDDEAAAASSPGAPAAAVIAGGAERRQWGSVKGKAAGAHLLRYLSHFTDKAPEVLARNLVAALSSKQVAFFEREDGASFICTQSQPSGMCFKLHIKVEGSAGPAAAAAAAATKSSPERPPLRFVKATLYEGNADAFRDMCVELFTIALAT